MQAIDKKELIKKLDLVIDKLMNLDGPANENELKEGGEAIGFFKRDFGIREWDWPSGSRFVWSFESYEEPQP